MGERGSVEDPKFSAKNKILLTLVGLGIVAGGAKVSSEALKTPAFTDKAIGNEQVNNADNKEMQQMNEMVAGPKEKIRVVAWGEESDDKDGVRTLEDLREKAGWPRSSQKSFEMALGVINGDAYNENGDLMPGEYEIPVVEKGQE